jgi:hypothetical protein
MKDVFRPIRKDSLNELLITVFVREGVLIFVCDQVVWKGDDENDLVATWAEEKEKENFISSCAGLHE